MFHVKHAPAVAELRAQAENLGCELDDVQAGLLLAFERLLVTWAIPQGLVARGDAPRIRARHVLDSLRASLVVEPRDRLAYYLGSGAGLPGIVVAVSRPSLAVQLVEARRARVAFLEMVVADLRLSNARVRGMRIEELAEPADLCFARALASPQETWRTAAPLLDRGGRLVLFLGAAAAVPRIPGIRVQLRRTSVLESAGPLAIMTRK